VWKCFYQVLLLLNYPVLELAVQQLLFSVGVLVHVEGLPSQHAATYLMEDMVDQPVLLLTALQLDSGAHHKITD
jgi:hypothetical protein